MKTLTLTIVVLVVYMLAMLLIGWFGRKKDESFNDYVTAAKRGSFLMVCGSYLGSHIGNGVVVGGAQNGADYMLGGVWYGLGACLSYIVFSVVMAKRLYRDNCLTLSESLDKRYGGHLAGTIFAVVNCGAAMSIMAGQIVAGKNLFSYLGLDPILGAVLCSLVVFLYASFAGQWGVMTTDVIQTGVVFVGTIAAMVYLAMSGGFSLMTQALPGESWTLFSVDADIIVRNAVPTILYGLVSCASFQRNTSAKDEKTAARSAFWGGVILIPFVFLPVLIGMYGRAMFPDADSASIIFKVMLEAFPPALGAVMIAALMAAVMSTVDSQLIYVTASLTNDIYVQFINKNPDQKKLARIGRLITLCAGLLTLWIALDATSITNVLSYAYTFMCAGTLVMFVGGVFWKRGTLAGAVSASGTGMLFVFLYKVCGVTLPFDSVFPILPSLIVYIVVSLCTQPKKNSAAV